MVIGKKLHTIVGTEICFSLCINNLRGQSTMCEYWIVPYAITKNRGGIALQMKRRCSTQQFISYTSHISNQKEFKPSDYRQ